MLLYPSTIAASPRDREATLWEAPLPGARLSPSRTSPRRTIVRTAKCVERLCMDDNGYYPAPRHAATSAVEPAPATVEDTRAHESQAKGGPPAGAADLEAPAEPVTQPGPAILGVTATALLLWLCGHAGQWSGWVLVLTAVAAAATGHFCGGAMGRQFSNVMSIGAVCLVLPAIIWFNANPGVPLEDSGPVPADTATSPAPQDPLAFLLYLTGDANTRANCEIAFDTARKTPDSGWDGGDRETAVAACTRG